jgi:hypothetical protein
MATFNNLASGGVLATPSSVVQSLNPYGGFKCINSPNKTTSISKGEWVTSSSSNRLNGGNSRSSAYVAAITVCTYDLKYKIQPVIQRKVMSGGMNVQRVNQRSTGGIVIGGHSLQHGHWNVHPHGGAVAGGTFGENYNTIYEFFSGGLILGGSSSVSSDFAPSFDGSFYLNCTSPTGLPTSGPRSILGWVRPNKASNVPKAIFGYGNAEDHVEFIFNHNGTQDIGLDNGDGVMGALNTNFNNWVLVAMVYDGTNLTIEGWDGSVGTDSANVAGFITSSDDLRIGFQLDGLGYDDSGFIGDIKGFGIWDRALSYDDIASYYYSGRCGYSGLPSRLSLTQTTIVSNAQSKRENLSDLESSTGPIITSSGDSIRCGSNGLNDIYTSSGSHLEFSHTATISSPPVSFWDLTESDGVRYDSVGSNNLSVISSNVRHYAHIFNESKSLSSSSTSYYPSQLASVYNFPTGLNGSGQTIGFIELGGGYSQTDLHNYFAAQGLTTPTVRFVSVDGATNHPTNPNSADAEVMLDLCVAIGVAQGINATVYMAPNTYQGFIDAIARAISDRVNVISISWGAPENTWPSQYINAMNSLFQNAANLGITVCVASGDSGSGDGEPGLHVDFPGSSPYVLCCGGTHLVTTGSNWSSETVWHNSYGATGGGFSSVFAKPTWQNSANTGSVKRGVPDVAAVADPSTGIKVICDGQNIVIGGTSAAAPFWAGLVAIINQGLGSGHNLGFFNSRIYGGLPSNSSFHDVTSGNNGGYSARAGWDACTGLGTPIGTSLKTYLQNH